MLATCQNYEPQVKCELVEQDDPEDDPCKFPDAANREMSRLVLILLHLGQV